MNRRLSQKDIELPLITKDPRSFLKVGAYDLEGSPKPNKPKYFGFNLLNHIMFSWVNNFIKLGKVKPFEQEQHYNLRESEECQAIAERFYLEWEKVKGKSMPLIRTQYRSFTLHIWLLQILALLYTAFEFTAPVLVAKIISYTQQQDPEPFEGICLVLGFILSRVGILVISTQNMVANNLLQSKIMKGSLALIYRKALQFPLMRNQKYSAGSILNHMLSDVENMSKIFCQLAQLIQFPITLGVGLYIMYLSMGMAFIGGVGTLGLIGVLIMWITKIMYKYQKNLMECKDGRMKKTNEILVGIKYIKMCGTENKFLDSVNKEREKELKWLKLKHMMMAFRTFLFWTSPIFLSIAVFGCYIMFNGSMTPQKAFVVLSTLMIIQGPIFNIGHLLNDVMQGQVSLDRVQQFLFSDEIDTSYIEWSKNTGNKVAVEIKNGNFYWIPKEPTNENKADKKDEHNRKQSLLEKETESDNNKPSLILKNINVEIKKGSFVAIIGEVGSGKSSFFNSILGEMLYDSQNAPLIQINGTIAYVAQKPWITNATIKDNILFDREFNEHAYNEAIRTSCLQADLKTFDKKDQTEIGEKGVNLSGGQKARVALARAIYADSDIYLLDDPLSAVDAHVGQHIIKECLMGLLKNKTRILVTHKLESLQYVDYIYVLKEGQIVAEGNFDTIRKTPYYSDIQQQQRAEQEEADENARRGSEARSSMHEEEMLRKSSRKKTSVYEEEDQKKMLDQLMLSEDRQTGAVSLAIWKSFFRYFWSMPYFILVFSVSSLWIVVKTSSDFWLAYWSSNAENDQEHGNSYYYGIYIAIGLTSGILILVRLALVIYKAMDAAKRLHGDMFSRVIRAPLNIFFDRIPLGRLINRFASDLDVIDNPLPFMLAGMLFLPINLVARFVVCSIAGTVWVIPLAFIFVWTGFRIQQTYLSVYREAFRISRITVSPITSMFAESLDGLTQIRSSNYQSRFLSKYCLRHNEDMKNQILLTGLQGWFFFRINLASLLIIGPCITAAILFSHKLGDSPGLMGLLVTYLLDLSGAMIGLLQQFAGFESQLISFERCQAFTKIESEKDPYTKLPVKNYSNNWPESGDIEFRNLYAKYRPNLPNVLNNVSLYINPSEKIGVVGRTGSGKSTLLLCLLRIIEPLKGQIFIIVFLYENF